MADVAPIQGKRRDPYRRKLRPEPLNLPIGDEAEDQLADLAIETGPFLEFRRPGIQNRVFQDLQRGVIEWQATLDLHGLRVREARTALLRFLGQSTAVRRRCVRIIHGKGQGVLRTIVQGILQDHPHVESFGHPADRGSWGATVAKLRI